MGLSFIVVAATGGFEWFGSAEIARILVEFLEVAITSVVFLKGVYLNGAFERRRRHMNVVVHKARHPQLNEYIHSAVNGLLPFVEKGLVERVAVIFFDDGDVPIERFVFKLNVNQSYPSTVEPVDLEFSLRSFLIKLPVSEALTKTLPRSKYGSYVNVAFVGFCLVHIH
ncbi:DNA polymerase zeta processivity subunit [Orobanche gracilis]